MPDTPTPLPCPFCGSEAIYPVEGEFFRWIQVMCADCYARGPAVRHNSPRGYLDPSGAIQAWNTRHEPGKETP